MKAYELIEHTADIGIRVKGNDLKGLFKNAASAMFDIISEPRTKNPEPRTKNKKFTVKQKADSLDELFVNWLNELLSLAAAKERVFCGYRFKRLNEHSLEAEVMGCGIKNYKINTEIKAATYHELEVKKSKSGWEAKIIFDV